MADERITLERESTDEPSSIPKWMSNGEAGLAVFFSATAFLCLIAAGKALDTAFAFHASLGAAASLWAVFAIFNRYFDRPARCRPRKSTAVPITIWVRSNSRRQYRYSGGSPALRVGLLIASQLAWPALNFDLPWTSFGRLRPLHTSAVVFAFGGNVLIATSF